jgi:alpha-tubulin suppressor-like RCC1 family protein
MSLPKIFNTTPHGHPLLSIVWSLLTTVFLLVTTAAVQAQSLVPMQDVVQVAAGESHACALTTDGGVKCWGHNAYGQLGDGSTTDRLTPVEVTGLDSGVQAISAGFNYTCALTMGGAVKCWGFNNSGQLGDGSGVGRLTPVDVTGLGSGVQAIDASEIHTCALTMGGAVKCWGFNNSGQLGDGSTTTRFTPVDVTGQDSGIQAISTGRDHTCALTISGAVKCWGRNSDGQLGDSSTITRLTPVDVTGLGSSVQAISAGGSYTCALTTGGGAKCWGYNSSGRLGDGSTTTRLTPVDVTGLNSGVQAISAAISHTCALTTNGGMKCWGGNSNGQLGDGSDRERFTPVDVRDLNSDVQAISAGWGHTCAVTTGGRAKCWGWNIHGQLGDGNRTNRLTPVSVTGLGNGVEAVAAGSSHTCALTMTGGAKCWGLNGSGQLGDGSTTNRLMPVNVAALDSGVQALSAGGYSLGGGNYRTCALTTSGGVKCWGDNTYGALGDGGTTTRLTPVNVAGLGSGMQAVSVGGGHTCALTTGGGVKCWGLNSSGQLGDGSTSVRLTPVDVTGLGSGVQAISTGEYHTCALTTNGGVKCWGYNSSGRLGDGSTTTRLTPVDVTDLGSGVQAISAGYQHTCALTTGGGVKCWGANFSGQIGDGSTTQRLTPVEVTGLGSNVQAIGAGYLHACALTTGGSVKCWGYNKFGQLGDGSTTDRLTPVDVTDFGNGVQAINTGYQHTCALTAGEGVKCWGYNQFGQLGIGGRNYALPGDVMMLVLPEHDASLSTLALMPAQPGFAFAPEITHYQVPVDNAVEALAFTPTASNPAATITLNGQPINSGETSAALSLTIGLNTFILNVTAEDGTTQREYAVDVIRLSPAPVALSITIERLPDGFVRGGGEMHSYRITVANLGHQSAGTVQLSVPHPTGLTDVLWTCEAPAGCTPAQGGNAVAATFSLGSGQSAHVDLSGEVVPGVAFVDIRANASAASAGVSTQGGISAPANGIGVLKNGFE